MIDLKENINAKDASCVQNIFYSQAQACCMIYSSLEFTISLLRTKEPILPRAQNIKRCP